MTEPTAQPEDLTGAWQPEPPIGCMLPGAASDTPPEPAGAPRSAVQAADGPAGARHAHDRAQAAQGGSGFPDVQGRCPACNGQSLMLADGGYITCRRLDCPDPEAAHKAIDETAPSRDDGPSVAECAKADRAWDLQKAGE